MSSHMKELDKEGISKLASSIFDVFPKRSWSKIVQKWKGAIPKSTNT